MARQVIEVACELFETILEASDLGRFFFNGIISATGFSGLGLDMDKRFFASCS